MVRGQCYIKQCALLLLLLMLFVLLGLNIRPVENLKFAV
jgi:hypothetical protein